MLLKGATRNKTEWHLFAQHLCAHVETQYTGIYVYTVYIYIYVHIYIICIYIYIYIILVYIGICSQNLPVCSPPTCLRGPTICALALLKLRVSSFWKTKEAKGADVMTSLVYIFGHQTEDQSPLIQLLISPSTLCLVFQAKLSYGFTPVLPSLCRPPFLCR